MEQDIDIGVEVPEVPELPQVQDGQQDTTDWKKVAQERQEALSKMQGMTKRFQTKLKKLAEAPKPAGDAPKPAANQGSGLDYAKLAFLQANGITEDEDQTYLETLSKESGIELKDVLKKEWVQKELTERKAHRATAAATPSGGKRAGNQSTDQVDYWIQKGTLPPYTPENQELRRKIINARLKAEQTGNVFTSVPVVK